MRVWTALGASLAPPPCDENALVTNARAVLRNRVDVELGAVAPGSPKDVGFQYLKTADALLAAQAIAHDDFGRAAAQFRRIVSYQHADGSLPLLVYGPSVDAEVQWIDSDRTFFPGPAFWLPTNGATWSVAGASGSASDHNDSQASRFPTSSLGAPPIATDVALQMYRLSPYETAMGVVGHTTEAVAFLCDVYPMLRKLQHYLFQARQRSNETALLAAHHPWETLSPFSSHWLRSLEDIKSRPGYDAFIKEIPPSAKSRFARGAWIETRDAVKDAYEPMMFLGACYNRSNAMADEPSACRLNVYDVEFNAMALRSADAFADICRVLAARSSTCPSFDFEVHQVLDDLEVASQQSASLRAAIAGNESTPSRLWNATTQIFSNDIADTDGALSLRELMPAYAIQLKEEKMKGILSHFLRSSDTFQFLCSHHPVSYFPCGAVPTENATTLLPYNYYAQRAFSTNGFPGMGVYVRNMTRDLVCASSNGNFPVALAYLSDSGRPISTFEDSFAGSSLAAALLVNILLPDVTSPPSPDALPVDHRMLTVIMCVELVVAFGVALGCVFLSVYFVVNRPRDKRPRRPASDHARARKRREARSERSDGVSVASSGNESQSSFGSSMDLEEGLLSEDDDPAYGSFGDRQGAHIGSETPSTTWQALKDALASISPW